MKGGRCDCPGCGAPAVMTATLTTMRTRKVWQKINACWQHVPEVEAYLEGLEWEGKIFSRYRGKQSVPPPAPISRTNREGPPLMPGTIHVRVPDSLQAYRTLHIRPGGRIEVLLRSGVRMEYSQ